MVSLIGIGDNVADKFLDRHILYPGGNAFNVSVFASRNGAKSAYLGIYGTDEIAAHNRATLAELGVDDSHSRQVPGENGCALVQTVDGDRIFVGSNKGGVAASTPWEFCAEDLAYIRGYDIIHTSINSYIDAELSLLAESGVPISYDFSTHWNAERSRQTGRDCSIAFLSCSHLDEMHTLQILRETLDGGYGIAVGTRGAEGSIACCGGAVYRQAAIPVDVVDTMGAGDGYIAGFLVALCRQVSPAVIKAGDFPEPAIRSAMAAGAAFARNVCEVEGAFGFGLPFEATEESDEP